MIFTPHWIPLSVSYFPYIDIMSHVHAAFASIPPLSTRHILPFFSSSVYASLATATESAHEIDHQLDIDIPRCHQYHPLLAAADVHIAFRRVLKAWVAASPALRYWQGLDSLAAPLLALLWPDEALTFATLQV